MKRILVPTDFSEASINALTLARTLAIKSGAEVYLVNFLEHPYDESFSTTGDVNTKYDDEETLFTLQLLRKSKQRLHEIAQEYGQDITLHTQVYGEDLVDGVEEYIQKNVIDFIVMGTTGEETVEEFFTGNHTEQIIEKVNCPVLTLRKGQQEVDFSKIVVGVDYKHDSKANYLAATKYLVDFVEAVDAQMHLVHVSKPNADTEEAESELDDFAEKFHLTNYTTGVQLSKDVEDGLLRSVSAQGAGMICVLTHHEGGFFRFFSHSVTEDLSKESDVPVLSINLHRV